MIGTVCCRVCDASVHCVCTTLHRTTANLKPNPSITSHTPPPHTTPTLRLSPIPTSLKTHTNPLTQNPTQEAAEELAKQKAALAARQQAKIDAGKSSILFDIKPWDSETNMEEMETRVRSIEMEGLLWGASELKEVRVCVCVVVCWMWGG